MTIATEKNRQLARPSDHPGGNGADGQSAVAPADAPEAGAETPETVSATDPVLGAGPGTGEAPGAAVGQGPARRGRKRLVVLAVVAVAVIAAICLWPQVHYALHHASTDDAMVNSHITYISPRVTGVAQQVLVDDNQYVEQGTLLVTLDTQMLRLMADQQAAELAKAKATVEQQVAMLGVANAELDQARTQVRGQLAGLRGAWYLVATVQDFVRYETASLEANEANLRQQQANLRLAQEEYERVTKLGPNSISQEEIDQRHTALLVSQEQVNSAVQNVQQTRALLGLRGEVGQPTTVPSDLGQTFNGTQYAVASFQQVLTQLGVPVEWTVPKLSDLKDRAMSLSVDSVVEHAPAVLAAKARVVQARATLGGDAFDPTHPESQPAVIEAQKALDEARLRLSYGQITAPISGYVTRRSVNPGTHVQEGQELMAIRPLREVWIDANFKETQLSDLRIGQSVELRVDAYPNRIFHGRVAGFSAGTGAVMSLLPPENATGNFVKVVQRLPVRIELTEENPKDTPLLAGLSVVPEVDLATPPAGPDAGQRLMSAVAAPGSAVANGTVESASR